MIRIYASSEMCGVVNIEGLTGEVLYGETCEPRRLGKLLALMNLETEIVVHVDRQERWEMLARETSAFDMEITKYVIDETLDVRKELKLLAVMKKRQKKFKCRAVFATICSFIAGILLGVVVGVPFAKTFIDNRLVLIEQAVKNIDAVTVNSSRQVDAAKLYQDIKFIFSPEDIQLLEVEDSRFRCIFTSTKSGMQNVVLPSTQETTLIESKAVTEEDRVLYFYTLEGNLKI